jgi:hypothetical protein
MPSLSPAAEERGTDWVAQASGFSLHAGVAAEADQRGKLERLCRYVSRPAVAIERLSVTAQGHIRYAPKTPYRDGTTHVMFEPLDFLARLSALVPSLGVNLTRYETGGTTNLATVGHDPSFGALGCVPESCASQRAGAGVKVAASTSRYPTHRL